MPTNREQLEALLEEVERIADSVADETDAGKDIANSLGTLNSSIEDALDKFGHIDEHLDGFVTTFSEWKDSILQHIELLGETIQKEFWRHQRELGAKLEGLSSDQIGAMFASAAMVRNAIERQTSMSDPRVQAGQRWAYLFEYIVRLHNSERELSYDQLVDELAVNLFTKERSILMVDKLIDKKILKGSDGVLRLDTGNSTFKKVVAYINAGVLPVLE